jgi:hypothetical protein
MVPVPDIPPLVTISEPAKVNIPSSIIEPFKVKVPDPVYDIIPDTEFTRELILTIFQPEPF